MVSTHLKNISQNGNLPQVRMTITIFWNHHLEYWLFNRNPYLMGYEIIAIWLGSIIPLYVGKNQGVFHCSVGGWTNPSEQNMRKVSNWIISPGIGVKIKTCLNQGIVGRTRTNALLRKIPLYGAYMVGIYGLQIYNVYKYSPRIPREHNTYHVVRVP